MLMRFRFGDCLLDEESRDLQRDGKTVHLTPKAFQLLNLLLRERPRAIAKSALYDQLWPDTFVAESNLPSLIKEIRKAADDEKHGARLIRTVHGYGYAFGAVAEEVRPEETDAQSVVIFPFESSEEESARYLANGLSEGLINRFARLENFRVTPRSTAQNVRSLAHDPLAVQRRLGAHWIVTGKVEVEEERTRVQVDLIDAHSATQVWGKRYEQHQSQLAALDDEIAMQLSAALSARLQGGDAAPVDPPKNDAYLAYLRGRYHWNQRSAESFNKALNALQEAVALDPNYALAHVALADLYVTIASRELRDPRQAFALALEHATVALRIDPLLAEGYCALAAIHEMDRWDWSEAQALFRKALALKSNCATTMQWYALHLARRGRHDEARTYMERAAGLEPLSLIINTNRGLLAYLRGDFVAADDLYDRVLELDGTFEGALLGKATTLGVDAREEEALVYCERLSSSATLAPLALALRGHALASLGRADEAAATIEQLQELRKERYLSPGFIALPLVALHRYDEAIDYLSLAVELKSAWMVYLLTEPRFDPLRGDRRFEGMLKKIGWV